MQTNQTELAALRQTADIGTPLPTIVDQLTAVQVQIAVLEVLEKNLKAQLVASGLKEICGSNTRAVVSLIDAGVTVSWQKVAKELSPPADLISKHSSKKEAYSVVKLYGYN